MVKTSSLTLVILAPLLAFLVHQYLFAGVDAPPSDFGSGSMFDSIAPREYRLLSSASNRKQVSL